MEKETNENLPRFQDPQPLQSPDEIINNNHSDTYNYCMDILRNLQPLDKINNNNQNDAKQKLTVKNLQPLDKINNNQTDINDTKQKLTVIIIVVGFVLPVGFLIHLAFDSTYKPSQEIGFTSINSEPNAIDNKLLPEPTSDDSKNSKDTAAYGNFAGSLVYYNRALAKYDLGDKEDAIKDFNQAIALDHKYVDAYIGRGYAKYGLGDKEGAIKDYNQAIGIDVNAPNEALAYVNRGIAKYDLGDKKGAIKDYSQAISIDPENTDAYVSRAKVKANLGDKKGAFKDYNQTIILQPNNSKYADAYVGRGLAKFLLFLDNEGALKDCNKAILLDPNFAEAYYARSLVRKILGDNAGAASDYSKYLDLLK